MHAHLDLVLADDPDHLDIGPARQLSRRQHIRVALRSIAATGCSIMQARCGLPTEIASPASR